MGLSGWMAVSAEAASGNGSAAEDGLPLLPTPRSLVAIEGQDVMLLDAVGGVAVALPCATGIWRRPLAQTKRRRTTDS